MGKASPGRANVLARLAPEPLLRWWKWCTMTRRAESEGVSPSPLVGYRWRARRTISDGLGSHDKIEKASKVDRRRGVTETVRASSPPPTQSREAHMYSSERCSFS